MFARGAVPPVHRTGSDAEGSNRPVRNPENSVKASAVQWDDSVVARVPSLVHPDAYVQRVRRHPPSSLLPLVAAVGAAHAYPDTWLGDRRVPYRPWALADVARVSVCLGNEHRGTAATEDDLREILTYYFNQDDPFRHDTPGQRTGPFLLRLSAEQLVWQHGGWTELARTAALFEDTTPTRPLTVIRPGWDRAVLGCSLAEYVGTAQMLHAAATTFAGRYDPQTIPAHERPEFERLVPLDTVDEILDAHFSTTAVDLRAAHGPAVARGADPLLRRYTYNPLHATPAIRGYGPGHLIPVPGLVIAKASPLGLYYTGIQHHSTFAHDLGDLFEQYVGRQLRLLEDVDPAVSVHGEIEYSVGRDRRKSVDWIVVFADLVLLVEVKSTRPTEAIRLGAADWAAQMDGRIGKALKQIDTTAALIRDRHPQFAHLPDDRPIIGVAITMEPFHLANALDIRSALPATHTPSAIAGIGDLENAVCVTEAPLAGLLLHEATVAAPAQNRGWSLRQATGGLTGRDNPILAAVWSTYPWSETDPPRTA